MKIKCTSFSCLTDIDECTYNNCSHKIFIDTININGKKYTFEFNPWFGVNFLNKNGSISRRTIGEKHPFWGKFNRWLDKLDKKYTEKG